MDDADLMTFPPEDLQRGQPLDDVQEVPGKHREGIPLPLLDFLREKADENHEQGNHRHRDHDREGRNPILLPGDEHEYGGRDRGEHELRQVRGEVLVQRVQPVRCCRRHGSARATRKPARSEPRHSADNVAAQLHLGAGGCQRRHDVREPGHCGPHSDRPEGVHERAGDVRNALSAEENPNNRTRDEPGEYDDSGDARQPHGYLSSQEPARRPGVAEQTWI